MDQVQPLLLGLTPDRDPQEVYHISQVLYQASQAVGREVKPWELLAPAE